MHGRVSCQAYIRIYRLAKLLGLSSNYSTGSDAEVIAYSAVCTHGSSLIPDPPLHVCVCKSLALPDNPLIESASC